MTPKISAIIATRNRCAVLPRAIESARCAGSDVEIIVVDDASEDRTREVCEARADVRYLRARRRLGLGGARNVGIVASSAPYISFLDDDDVRLPASLDTQIEILEAQPEAGMIYGRALYGDEACRSKGGFYPEQCPRGDIFWQLLSSNFIPCPTVVFRRACLTRIGLLDEAAPGIEDWDLWVRIAELYPVLALEQAVAIWRQPTPASGQFTSCSERLHREARRLHRDKWLRLPRAFEAGSARRRKARRVFSDYASRQMIWEAAGRMKDRRLTDFARVAYAVARMHPGGLGRQVVSALRSR
ncbi:MAG: glycosyl transferase [Acidobacteria bacterium]|nr:glycosyl transferase [Acidobacteriota bacterium]